jgi:hypothetical protein
MNIYLDSYYKIGSSHEICEDYALTGKYKDLNYAIVSDGCSACEGVDLGARMLSFIAREALRSFYDRGKLTEDKIDQAVADIKLLIIDKMKSAAELIQLEKSALSATLLMAVHIKKGITFFLGWGDGYFVEKRGQETHIHKVEFESGGPFYLNYHLKEPEDLGDPVEVYKIASKNNKAVLKDYLALDSTVPKLIHDKKYAPTDYCFFKVLEKVEAPTNIAIFSDGGDTFISGTGKKSSYYSLDFLSIQDLVNYKKTKKNFAEKTYKKYMDFISNENASHYDDLSSAAMLIGGLIKNTKKGD